jgi:LmbE family N-acetylglucosaminyl deacetylase
VAGVTQPATRRLAAVVAHPDDDTWSIAGTVALHADDPAFRFTLVHATSGEAGQISDPALATRETLGAVREEEDRRSWVALGREPDRHEWLRHPDHRVEEQPFGELVDRIAGILLAERPDVVMTFGPDGITAHPDHITVGRAATEAFHRGRAAGGRGFRRLIHTAIPASSIASWNAELVAAGREPFDPAELYQPHGVPDDTIGLRVDTSSVAPRVLVALREHATQANDWNELTDHEQVRALSLEHGVVAWPPRDPGSPVLTSVFEGL